MNSNVFTIQSWILCKDWFLRNGIKHRSNTILSMVWLLLNQSLFHRNVNRRNFGLPFLSLVFRKLVKVVSSKNSTVICSCDKIRTKEFCWQKQLALPNITSREQRKYLHLGVHGFHDGKLCQMILLYVAHSNYQIQMPDLWYYKELQTQYR